MKQTTFPALGTTWWIEIFDDIEAETADLAFGQVRGFLTQFEDNYSRFKPNSKVSKLNTEGVYVNPDHELKNILSLGQTLYEQTDGAFNFLIGDILQKRGYDQDYSFRAQPTLEILPHPLQDIIISSSKITLCRGKVDLGGYGKGYAIDRVKELLLGLDIRYFLINGGGDMFATSDHGKAITIYLEHPLQPDTYISETTILNQGFAASSPYKRQWRSNNQTYSHIVSRGTLPLGATFTKARSAMLADAFATTALLLSPKEIILLAERLQVSVAYFDPSFNEVWYTLSF